MIDLADVVRLKVEIRDVDGNLADPTGISVTITLPDGTTDTPDPVHDSTGVYLLDYPTVQSGRHLVRWVATGNNASAYVEVFEVREADWPSIISLADAKDQLNSTATTDDEEIRGYVEAATRVVEHYVGAVVRRQVTDTFSGGRTRLVLATTPILSVDTVTDTGTDLDDGDWSVNLATGILTYGTGFLPGTDTVTVAYTVGWTVIPANFLLAAKIIIQHMWETQRGSTGSPMWSGSTGPVTHQGTDIIMAAGYGFSIPRRAVELLEPDLDVGGVA